MIIKNTRIPKLTSSPRIIDLINFAESDLNNFQSILTCIPEGFGFIDGYIKTDLGLISKTRCYGCLACLDIGDCGFINENGIPSDTGTDLSSISEGYFQGKYCNSFPNYTKFGNYNCSAETTRTTPIAANLLLSISDNIEDIYLRCSPNWELSIDTTSKYDPREGHIDLTILNKKRKRIIVLECKAHLSAFLRDRKRDQWNRYYNTLFNDIQNTGYELVFLYLIGGDETVLYPKIYQPPTLPGGRTDEFYQFIINNNKKFISLEALRQIKLRKLSNNPSITWEKQLFPILNSKDYLGLVSGGVISNNLILSGCF